MIAPDIEARILRFHHAEKWRIGTIARELGVHHSTVRRVLAQAGVPEALRSTRPSKADAFIPLIVETLEKHPHLRASRLYDMVRERGYSGHPDHFRHIVARYRPRPKSEAYLRLRTLPGEQAQVDWGHFGSVRIGRAVRKLFAFVMVLSWSRKVFLRFGFDIGMHGFLRGHVEGFDAFLGVPRVILYDNLKSAVLERVGEAIHFHPTLLELAGHYRYEPRPCAVARGNEKGRVERAIQYIRHRFFAARQWRDVDDLNRQAIEWCDKEARERRCPEDHSMSVDEAFVIECQRLLPLPDDDFPCDERRETSAHKTPYVRFDLNDYSIPHTHVGRPLIVMATPTEVRVLDGLNVVATHKRSFDKAEQVEDPSHVAALAEQKHAASRARAQDRLATAAPQSRDLLCAMAERGGNIGSATSALIRLLDHYGAAELQAAIAEAMDRNVAHPNAVRLCLERRRHARGLPPPVAVALPPDRNLENLHVQPHRLADYDHIPHGNNPPKETSDE